MCFEISEDRNYQNVMQIAKAILESYIREDKFENARELLRKLSLKLQPPSRNQKKFNCLLADKLAFLVKYGRTVNLEEETLEQVYSGTLSRMERLT